MIDVIICIMWIVFIYFAVSVLFTITVMWNEMEDSIKDITDEKTIEEYRKSGCTDKEIKRKIRHNYYGSIIITALIFFPHNLANEIKNFINKKK